MSKISNINLDGHIFTCSKCGSHNVTKILKPWGEKNFYSGHFMCSDCGTSICFGKEINYYNPAFKKVTNPKQLELF